MKRIAVSIILLLLVSITLTNPTYADGGPKIVSSLEKIILTKDTGIWINEPDNPIIKFNLINIGNQTARNVDIIFANLTISEINAKTINEIIIDHEENMVYFVEQDIAAFGEDPASVIVALSTDIETSSTYSGKLVVYGENFEPTTIKFDYIVKHNAWDLVAFTIMGLVFAIVTGILVAVYQRYHSPTSFRSNKKVIIHVNGHIDSANIVREYVDSDIWNMIVKLNESKRKKIIKKYNDGKILSDDLEEIKWYEHDLKNLVNKILTDKTFKKDNAASGGESDLNYIIEKKKGKFTVLKKNDIAPVTRVSGRFITYDEKNEWFIIKEKTENDIEQYIVTGTKYITPGIKGSKADYITLPENYGDPISENNRVKERLFAIKDDVFDFKYLIIRIGAGIASIPLTLFTSDYFMGEPLTDVLIAFGIGFIVYRSQDISKIIKSKAKEEG